MVRTSCCPGIRDLEITERENDPWTSINNCLTRVISEVTRQPTQKVRTGIERKAIDLQKIASTYEVDYAITEYYTRVVNVVTHLTSFLMVCDSHSGAKCSGFWSATIYKVYLPMVILNIQEINILTIIHFIHLVSQLVMAFLIGKPHKVWIRLSAWKIFFIFWVPDWKWKLWFHLHPDIPAVSREILAPVCLQV